MVGTLSSELRTTRDENDRNGVPGMRIVLSGTQKVLTTILAKCAGRHRILVFLTEDPAGEPKNEDGRVGADFCAHGCQRQCSDTCVFVKERMYHGR
ncbi:Hypothetical predicted protein [Cloeon dipterum]|uniref:Uncharacterized protein n=1 Tax=Cloeon dipterum TaxID=197152 RepID=A0A8S1DHP0_9INSE|nr:Hypothetical predicted protein [Cloeon dipterum]